MEVADYRGSCTPGESSSGVVGESFAGRAFHLEIRTASMATESLSHLHVDSIGVESEVRFKRLTKSLGFGL
jgi:hypothetical protein